MSRSDSLLPLTLADSSSLRLQKLFGDEFKLHIVNQRRLYRGNSESTSDNNTIEYGGAAKPPRLVIRLAKMEVKSYSQVQLDSKQSVEAVSVWMISMGDGASGSP